MHARGIAVPDHLDTGNQKGTGTRKGVGQGCSLQPEARSCQKISACTGISRVKIIPQAMNIPSRTPVIGASSPAESVEGEDDTFMSEDGGAGRAITPPCVAGGSGRRYVAVARDAHREIGWRRTTIHWKMLSSAPRQLTGRSPEAMGFEEHLVPQFDSERPCDLGQLRFCFAQVSCIRGRYDKNAL